MLGTSSYVWLVENAGVETNMDTFEQQSIFPTQFNGHGFHIRDYIKGSTELQEGPYVYP